MNSSDRAKTPPVRRKNLPGKLSENVAETLLQQCLKCLKNHCFSGEKNVTSHCERSIGKVTHVCVRAPRRPPEKQIKL